MPTRTAAIVLVPVVLVSVAVIYGGWSGWVPVIAGLAVLGTLAVVAPTGRVWGAVVAGTAALTGRPADWVVRSAGWFGAGMLLVAGVLAMAGVAPV